MPYTTISQAKSAGFPTQAEGVPMTIAQINKLAAIYDAVKENKAIKTPFAVAWTQWKKLYKKVGDKWVSMSEIAEMRKVAEMIYPVSLKDLTFQEIGGKDISEIQVLQVGAWRHPVYGKIKISENDLDEFVENFENQVRKDIPITEGHSDGNKELPAIGWFKQLINKGRNGLWATIEWTKDGIALLKKKAYKYFSPEFYSHYEDPEDHKIYHNVLVGGALTNRPYFKGLIAIMLSETELIKMELKLEEIVAKEATDLTDEETAFLKEKENELTDEQKEKFKDVLVENKEEEEEEKKEEEEKEEEEEEEEEEIKGDEKVMIDKKTLKHLEMRGEEGVKAMAILRKQEATHYIESLTFSETNRKGLILPKSRDKVVAFLLSLTEEQQKKFKEVMAELPKVDMFSELGKESGIAIKASEEIEVLVKAKMEKDQNLEYRQALGQVFAERPDLAEAVEKE